MKRVVVAVIAGMLATFVPTAAIAVPVTFQLPTVAVLGGSMTARYTDDIGSRAQGWWSMAADRLNARVVSVAGEVDSSITARGLRCQGTTYTERLKYLPRVDALFVEAGTYDDHVCVGPSKRKRLTVKQRQTAFKKFADALARRVDRLGIARSRVYLVTPVVPGDNATTRAMRAEIKRFVARRHGFTYVREVRLTGASTYRDTFANRSGNAKIAARVTATVKSLPRRPISRAQVAKQKQRPGPVVTVFGTSLTSFFSDHVGSPAQGWWSMAARSLNASTLRVSAEGGSGVMVRGNKCSGTTFGERLKYLKYSDIVIIEVGRNDARRCVSDTAATGVTPEYQVEQIARYVRQVSKRIKELGISPSSVYFLTPWDMYYWGLRTRLQGMIRDAVTAPEAGFTFIETPRLREHLTVDGSHPNRRGNKMLAQAVTRAIS